MHCGHDVEFLNIELDVKLVTTWFCAFKKRVTVKLK